MALFGIICALHFGTANDVDFVKNWGDLTESGSVVSLIKTKIAIPLIRREFTVSYPNVCICNIKHITSIG